MMGWSKVSYPPSQPSFPSLSFSHLFVFLLSFFVLLSLLATSLCSRRGYDVDTSCQVAPTTGQEPLLPCPRANTTGSFAQQTRVCPRCARCVRCVRLRWLTSLGGAQGDRRLMIPAGLIRVRRREHYARSEDLLAGTCTSESATRHTTHDTQHTRHTKVTVTTAVVQVSGS